jgi:hypothetical protein
MPGSLRLLVAAVVLVSGSALLPPVAAAGAATPSAPPVPLNQWVATFCQTFSTYETDALQAAGQLQTAIAGVPDSTAGRTTTVALSDSLRQAGNSAARAARAATANGVPDVKNGRALTKELRAVLAQASRIYADQSQRAGSKLPVEPKRLSAAAKQIGTNLRKGLSAQGEHAKRLQKLDASNAMGGAIAADPTCAAAANAGGTEIPAQPSPPSTSTP